MCKNDGGPAFPNYHIQGMTLRDYFAGQALVSAMAFGVERNLSEQDMAESSYVMADAMLAAREGE